MRVLVLGAAGQIGSAFCKYAEAKGDKVVRWDINIDHSHDLTVAKNYGLHDYISVCDKVLFLACKVGGAKYLKAHDGKFTYLDENIKILSNVFNLLAIENYRPFLFASSQMVNMDTNYSLVKKLGEAYCDTIGPSASIVKFWNVFGPEALGEKAHVITDLVNMALTKNHINIMTDGSETRQFLYVDDCSEALYKWCHGEIPMQRFDVTSFQWTSILDIANLIASKVGCQVTKGPVSRDLQSIKNEPNNAILRHWHPNINLYQGIDKIIEYQRSLL